MEHTAKDPLQIKGWGVDADPKNDPTYPMKHRNDGEHSGYSWERAQEQPPTVEVLHSNERADLRVRYIDAALGTKRRAPPPGFQVQRIQLRPLVAPGAGRPSERGGRPPRRPNARPSPQRLRRTGLKG
jgi:hypothetical protein